MYSPATTLCGTAASLLDPSAAAPRAASINKWIAAMAFPTSEDGGRA
jgi:hypothetical protein